MRKRKKMKKYQKFNWHTFGYGKETLQGKRGLYVYWLDDRCLYVGAAQDLYKRAFRIFRNPMGWGFNKLLKAIVEAIGPRCIKVEIYLVPRGSIEKAERLLEIDLKPFCSEFHHPYRSCLKKRKVTQ
jgi:hypothetical protein